ncbi:MAG: hypothetical protein ACT4PI_05920 [Actinomycetota bacterium]
MQLVDIPVGDGTYDAFVVWAETRADGTVALDLTITTGARKGEVVSVRAANVSRDPVELVGLPCALPVEDAQPRVEW